MIPACPPEADGAGGERPGRKASPTRARVSVRSDPGPRRDLEEIPSPQRSRSQSFEGLEKLVQSARSLPGELEHVHHKCTETTVAGTSLQLVAEAMDPHKSTEVPRTRKSWLRLVLGLDHTHNLSVQVKVHFIQDLLIIVLGGSFGHILFTVVYASGMDTDDQKDVINFVCYLGVLFIRLMRLLVLPLTFTAIATGVAGMVSHTSKRTLRAALIYMVGTSLLSIGLALLLGLQIRPGEVEPSDYLLRKAYGDTAYAALAANSTAKLEAVEENIGEVSERESTLQHVMVILDTLVPNNIFVAMAENNMLGLSFFSVLFGVGACSLDNDMMLRSLENLNQCIIAMIPYRMQPIAVFFLVAKVVATNERDFSNVIAALARFSGAVVLGLGIHAAVVLPLVYWAATRRNPYQWIKDMEAALFVAFCTCSSAATLPYTMHTVGTNWPRTSTARLVLPLGLQLNKNGTALYMTLVVVYIAQVTGQALNVERCVLIAIFVQMASMTTATIPGGSLMSVVYVLRACAPHEPGMEDRWLESVALVVPVDKVLDMFRTVVNVLGDTVACAVVDRYRTRRGLSTGRTRSKSLDGFDLEVIEASKSHHSHSHCPSESSGESAGQQEHEGQEDGGDEEAAKTSGNNSKFDDLHIPAHLSRMVRVP